jgi:nitrate reductase molybdenum cofactor assembly chaperone
MTGVSPFKLASVLLQYPTVALFDGLGQLAGAASAAPRASREPFGIFLEWLSRTPPDTVARHYVETFDLRRRCALYLTYYRYGDTRKRGMAMLAFKAAYRAAGFEPSDSELPDYLPLVLDFAALHPRGEKLLRAHRADLEPCCGRCGTPGLPTRTSWRPSARSSPRCAGQTRPWFGNSGNQARQPKRSAWSRSRRPGT